MSEIKPADALDLVCKGLEKQVMTHLTDSHARSTVESVVLILRAIQAELRDERTRDRDAMVAVERELDALWKTPNPDRERLRALRALCRADLK